MKEREDMIQLKAKKASITVATMAWRPVALHGLPKLFYDTVGRIGRDIADTIIAAKIIMSLSFFCKIQAYGVIFGVNGVGYNRVFICPTERTIPPADAYQFADTACAVPVISCARFNKPFIFWKRRKKVHAINARKRPKTSAISPEVM